MKPFEFGCRATHIQHSCKHGNESESIHPLELSVLIDELTLLLDGLEYVGRIKSPSNSYQINIDFFDSSLIKKINNETDWHSKTLSRKELPKGIQIIPDGIFTNGKTTVGLEIEKSNKKTIWFDLIKFMMLIDLKKINYGLLFVPKNYAHTVSVWNLFNDARNYRWCLLEYARVKPDLMANIAVMGYDNEASVDDRWQMLNSINIVKIKDNAKVYFQRN
jgi:hypothetical protein